MGQIVRASLFLSLALLLGRLSGFGRDIVLSARLGVSTEADVAVLLLTLPDMLVAILLAGGFASALVPAFRGRGPDSQTQLLRTAMLITGIGFCALAALVFQRPGMVFNLLAPAMPALIVSSYIEPMRLTALALPLAALTGVVAAYLNARDRFFLPGLGTLIFNGTVIILLLAAFEPTTGLSVLVIGILLGSALRFAALVPQMPHGLFTIQAPPVVDNGLAGRFLAGVIGTGALALAPILFRTFASLDGQGAIAAYSYALKLYELPNALLFSAIVTVLLPRFADQGDIRPLFHMGAMALLVLALATLITGQVFGPALAELAFLRGALDADGLASIVVFAKGLFWALVPAAIALLSGAALNARKRATRVMVHALFSLVIGAGIALTTGVATHGFVAFYFFLMILNLIALKPGWPQLTRKHLLSAASLGAALIVQLGLAAGPLSGASAFVLAFVGLLFWAIMVLCGLPVLMDMRKALRKDPDPA